MDEQHHADAIVDDLTSGDPPPERLRAFIADPSGFDGGRFRAAPPEVLEEAVRQVLCFLGSDDHPEAETLRAPAIPEIDVLLEAPARIGRYIVESELGRGGFGVVYLGRDPERERPVAIKVLARRVAPRLERRFYDEAWVTKNLPAHRNLVALIDVGRDQREGPFLVHEFVEGHDLADHRLPMSLQVGCRCLREIADAVSHLHAHRVIHRDLKPSNIRLASLDLETVPADQPMLKVLDLGIAALLVDEVPGGRRTQPGEMLGTLRYMAPEQLQGLQVDERADIYAFGLIAYEILVGRPPFGRQVDDVADRVRRLYRGPSSEELAGLPGWLAQLIKACLTFERTGRPDSFDEILRSFHLEQPPRIALKLREQQWRDLISVFPPPRIAGINPYKVLHLQRGEVGDAWDFEARLPPYVRRDADAELDAILSRDDPQFLLLAGPSKSGKSRAAFEALARNVGERPLLVPDRLEDVRRVIESLGELKETWPHPVLWLDNVHEHLRAQSLTSGLLQRALDEGAAVVATIWDSELQALGALASSGSGTAAGTAMLRAAREVLQHAQIVRLEGEISASERQRAKTLYPALDFDAGLGETFVARRLLLQRFDHGSPELKALVRALIDCTRAGLLEGAPLFVLREVMPFYLEQVDPGAWIPAPRVNGLLERALQQGMEPVGVHQRLVLHAGNDAFKVYDPVRYHVEQGMDPSRALPPALWQAVLGETPVADRRERESRNASDTAGSIVASGPFEPVSVNWVVAGLNAWQSGQRRIAEQAYRTGMQQGSAVAARSLGTLLASLDDREGARLAYQTALDLGDPNAAVELALLRGERGIEHAIESEPTSALGVVVRERDGVTVLELNGMLTLGSGYRSLHAVAHREMNRGANRFIVHLAAVTAIDPAGVGALVGVLTAATVRAKVLRLCCVPTPIEDILGAHGLIHIFARFDSESEALASYGAGPSDPRYAATPSM